MWGHHRLRELHEYSIIEFYRTSVCLFSLLLYKFWCDWRADPRLLVSRLQIHKWSSRVVRNITRKNWMVRGGYMERTFHMVVTPRVVKEVGNWSIIASLIRPFLFGGVIGDDASAHTELFLIHAVLVIQKFSMFPMPSNNIYYLLSFKPELSFAYTYAWRWLAMQWYYPRWTL